MQICQMFIRRGYLLAGIVALGCASNPSSTVAEHATEGNPSASELTYASPRLSGNDSGRTNSGVGSPAVVAFDQLQSRWLGQDPELSSPFNVRVESFGAVGDGITDDTAALQDALNALKNGGKRLIFRAGKVHLVTQQLRMKNASYFSIVGNNAVLRVAAGVPGSFGHEILKIEASHHFRVSDLVFNGNRTNRPSALHESHNFFLKNCQDFEVVRVISRNSVADGFYLKSSDSTDPNTFVKRGVFRDCIANNNYRQGMSIINGYDIGIFGGTYKNSNGACPEAGIDIESNPNSFVPGNKNIVIDGANFVGNNGYGVQIAPEASPENITVRNSYFSNNPRGGVMIGSANSVVKNNVFESFPHWATCTGKPTPEAVGAVIRIKGPSSNNNSIDDNVFSNIQSGEPIVYVQANSGIGNSITHNEFSDYAGEAILNANPAGTAAYANSYSPTP